MPLPIFSSLPLFMPLTLLSLSLFLPFADPDDSDGSGRTAAADLGGRRVDLGGGRVDLGDSRSWSWL
jgi:hypothetical protein